MTFTRAVSTNNYGPYKWIVSDTADGTHTTLAGALSSASSGDTIFLRKSVTENVTLKDGVNIIGPVSANLINASGYSAPAVTITGKLIDNGSQVYAKIQNIELVTNSDYVLTLSNVASSITFTSCLLRASNNTLVNFSAKGTISLYDCYADIETTGIAYTVTSGYFVCYRSFLYNTGASTTVTDVVTGAFSLYWSYCTAPLTSSSSGGVNLYNSQLVVSVNAYSVSITGAGMINGYNSYIYNTSNSLVNLASSSTGKFYNCNFVASSNQICIVTSSTATVTTYNCSFESGTTSAISTGTGTTANVSSCVINSSNTNTLDGAGTINFSGLSFISSTKKINTTTQSCKNSGTFTPTIAFGGGSTGITYTTNAGYYTRFDNIIMFDINIVLSNKGSSTGNATIQGLPFTSSNVITNTATFYYANLTYVATYTEVTGYINPANTNIILAMNKTAAGPVSLTNTQFANNTELYVSGFYFT